jgi:D-glycero-alpha-D-manno-heptose-7-phosphate kinase
VRVIISRTPFRISFFGGGTDYPAWYRRHGGAVLATTIDKYCYLSCRFLPPFFEHRTRLVYAKIENCKTNDEIVHPSVRQILKYLNFDRGVEIHHDGDLPARSGMGSSSSFTVGLLHALHALRGCMPSKQQLASESIHVEQNLVKEVVGSQDQVLAAHGGLRHVGFDRQGEVQVRPLTIGLDRMRELNAHLMLFYTGIKRTASDIAQTYTSWSDARQKQLHLMGALVEQGLAILNSGRDLSAFGDLLHEAWQIKRSLSAKVSNPYVDGLYETSRAAGALGGKLTGAGGGGFLLLFVPPDRHLAVRAALSQLIHVPFKFEFAGSQIIFFEPAEDYSAAEQARANQDILPFQELPIAA